MDKYIMKELSCGFILLNKKDKRQILACLPTGRKVFSGGNYDIPKGHKEEGESTLEAALRELKEETGITLTNEKIYDCGIFKYLAQKDLYIYIAVVDLNLKSLKCTSMFENRSGQLIPEISDYMWTDDISYFYKSLQPIISDCISHLNDGYYDSI